MTTDKLPSSVDVVVMGTGLSESMVSASLSRVGKKILHIDKNNYYASHWTTFSFKDLHDWCQDESTSSKPIENQNGNNTELTIPCTDEFVRNRVIKSFIKEKNEIEIEPENKKVDSEEVNNEKLANEVNDKPTEDTDDAKHKNIQTISENSEKPEISDTVQNETTIIANKPVSDSAENEGQTIVENMQESLKIGSDTVYMPKPVKKPQLTIVSQAKLKSKSTDISVEDFEILSRKFNLDLSPKFLYSAGPLVQSILKANISHYTEFKVVDRILTSKDGAIIEVPCNRSDVFGSTFLSMIEKRMLMKFLTFCVELDFESPSDELKEVAKMSFQEFLKSRRLTDNLQRFIIYSIAMVKPGVPTEDALRETCMFLESLNRYGKSPFIWPLYGVGELPQSFCRMSAVFGAIFCLQKPPISIVITDETITDESTTNSTSITEKESISEKELPSGNETTIKVNLGDEIIECKHLVVNRSYLPSKYISSEKQRAEISKAILITNESILPSTSEHVSFLTIPPLPGREELVRVIELGASSSGCPSGLFVLYLIVSSTSDAHADLVDYTNFLTKTDIEDSSCKPRLLWSVYFNEVADNTDVCGLPESVFVTCMPGSSLGFSDVVSDAERIFNKICPTEEFMMKVPNSEDIIWDTDEPNNTAEDEKSAGSSDKTDDSKDQSSSSNKQSESNNDQPEDTID